VHTTPDNHGIILPEGIFLVGCQLVIRNVNGLSHFWLETESGARLASFADGSNDNVPHYKIRTICAPVQGPSTLNPPIQFLINYY